MSTTRSLGAALVVGLMATPASGQILGTFAWQLQPFCNRVTILVAQTGGGFTLDGFDDRCGAAQRVPVRGLAILNPDGTVELGFTGIGETGLPVHVSARLSLPAATGTWRDSQGRGGAFALGAATGGPPLTTAVTIVAPPPGSGVNNTALGAAALQRNTTGGENTGVGAGALAANTTGGFNAASGAQALTANTSGDQNTAVGAWALLANTTGPNNTAVGAQALRAVTTNGFNTAVGAVALRHSTGFSNTALGNFALFASLDGNNNTAVGSGALDANLSGSGNTAIGQNALGVHSSGSGNVAIGSGSGGVLEAGGNNAYLLANAAAPIEINTLRLGNASHARMFVGGVRGRTTDLADALPVVIDSLGQLGTVSSSARTKDHIEPLSDEASSRVQRLRPVQFTYRRPFADGSTPTQFGLIAEEVQEVLPELVARGRDGEVESVKYHVLPTLLLAELQRLERERQAQAARIAELDRQLQRLIRAAELR